jgi:AcrR family transcriptional regulator
MVLSEKLQAPKRTVRNSLSEQLILDEALDMVRSGQPLSIRRVANGLRCTPMALYRYFPGKHQMVMSLIDRIMESVTSEPEGETWSERVAYWASNHLQTLQLNAWAIPLLMENPDPGPNVRLAGEFLLRELKASGQSDDKVVATFSAILALNYGWAGFTSRASPAPDGKSRVIRLSEDAPTAQELPTTAGYWKQLALVGTAEQHQIAIALLVSGLVEH